MKAEHYSHLFINNGPEERKFTSRGSTPRSTLNIERDRLIHGGYLKSKMEAVSTKLNNENDETGVYITIVGSEALLEKATSLEHRGGSSNIKISNIKKNNSNDNIEITLWVNKRSIQKILKKITDYILYDTDLGKPKNQPLINRIDDIKESVIEQLWVGPEDLIPQENLKKWCELWIMTREPASLYSICDNLNIKYNSKSILKFIDRTVLLVEVNKKDMKDLLILYGYIGEFRPINSVAKYFLDISKNEQNNWIKNLLERVKINKNTNTAICVLDTGANNAHPLLNNILSDDECDSVFSNWGTHDTMNHGTAMCGLATYGDIQQCLESSNEVEINHSISSIKIINGIDGENDPESYGWMTEDGVIRAELIHPNKEIINCMSVSEKSDLYFNLEGSPTSWSATLDKITSGQDIDNLNAEGSKRLFFISAGNINDCNMDYPKTNFVEPIENPGQAWNAITVGAFTEKFTSGTLANGGGLSPCSRTSIAWSKSQWPIKPEICFEGGGNKIKSDGVTLNSPEYSILGLNNDFINSDYFSLMEGTSPATARAAHFAATIKNQYPDLWPETIRALMIHSSEWTDEMINQFYINTGKKSDYINILRACGYGVPDLERALYSASNNLVLIEQNEIQPYFVDSSNKDVKTNVMHIYELPWPKEELISLGNQNVKLKVTLSYFIEPAPIGCITSNKYRYSSCGLRFDINKSTETKETLCSRINKIDNEIAKANEEEIKSQSGSPWKYSNECNINNGSLHSNVWEGSAIDLAESNFIAIYPVMGWWKDRKYLDCYNKKIRYSLIVSLSTTETEIDIYTPVATIINTPITIEIKS